MVKVVVAKLDSGSGPNGNAKTSVNEKQIRDAYGQVKTLRTLDVHSRTFGADIQYVFSKNVAKARRDNKRVTGSVDVPVAKR